MKALLIKPVEQTAEAIDIADYDEIVKLIGYDTVIFDDVGSQGDRLYFDEECFLRGTTGRFQLDKLIPVSGIGVIVGAIGDELQDVKSDLEGIRARVVFS